MSTNFPWRLSPWSNTRLDSHGPCPFNPPKSTSAAHGHGRSPSKSYDQDGVAPPRFASLWYEDCASPILLRSHCWVFRFSNMGLKPAEDPWYECCLGQATPRCPCAPRWPASAPHATASQIFSFEWERTANCRVGGHERSRGECKVTVL